MVALLVVVKRNRVALNMSVNVRARTIVIATELFAGHLQADVTAIAVVVEGVLPTISTTGEMATLLVVVLRVADAWPLPVLLQK